MPSIPQLAEASSEASGLYTATFVVAADAGLSDDAGDAEPEIFSGDSREGDARPFAGIGDGDIGGRPVDCDGHTCQKSYPERGLRRSRSAAPA